MKLPKQFGALARAGSALAIVLTLVGGVTFAALRSQNNVLSGSRLTSASADLNISRTNGTQWYTTINGFDFTDVMPGGEPGPAYGNDLYFKNGGTTNLDLRFGVDMTRLANPNGLDLQKVKLVIIDPNGGTVFASVPLTQLSAALTAGEPLPINIVLGKNSVTHLQVRMQLEAGAVPNATSQTELTNIDIVFSGVAQNG